MQPNSKVLDGIDLYSFRELSKRKRKEKWLGGKEAGREMNQRDGRKLEDAEVQTLLSEEHIHWRKKNQGERRVMKGEKRKRCQIFSGFEGAEAL